MERRRFIFYLATTTTAATVIGTAGLTALSGCQNRHPAASRLAQPDFLLQVSDTATIRAIGEAYRKQTPAESQASRLTALLENYADPQSIRRQYAQGNTVIIKGWVLSLTEARQCALYSLEPR